MTPAQPLTSGPPRADAIQRKGGLNRFVPIPPDGTSVSDVATPAGDSLRVYGRDLRQALSERP